LEGIVDSKYDFYKNKKNSKKIEIMYLKNNLVKMN